MGGTGGTTMVSTLYNSFLTLKSNLLENNILSNDCINFNLDLDYLRHPPCDLFLWIKPGEFVAHQPSVDSGATVLLGTVKLRLYILDSKDEANRDNLATDIVLNEIINLTKTLQLLCDSPHFTSPIRIKDISELKRHEIQHFLYVDYIMQYRIALEEFPAAVRALQEFGMKLIEVSREEWEQY